MKKEYSSILLSIAGALIFFLLLWLCLGLGIMIAAALSAGMYGALTLLTSPRKRIGKIYVEGLPDGAELEAKLSQAREDFNSIGSSMEAIEDQEMKKESARLHGTAGKILAYLEEHPDKIASARRFIDYYQDTASKLLDQYVELQDSGLGTPEVKRLKGQTRQALLALNRAFEGQFEKLMQNELLDMDVDIRVLKQTMEMEGLEMEAYEEKNT